MRIDDPQSTKSLSGVGLGLTLSEAHELRDSLDDLLTSPPGRHEHISSADYQVELTVWIVEGVNGEKD